MNTRQNYDAPASEQNLFESTVTPAVSLLLPLLAPADGVNPTARLLYWAVSDLLDQLNDDLTGLLQAHHYPAAALAQTEITALIDVQNQILAGVQGLSTTHPLDFADWANWTPLA